MLEKDSPEAREQTLQASIRAKVEHPFKVIKQVLGDSKVRYRGLLRILSD
jgi:transposase, IS5 family